VEEARALAAKVEAWLTQYPAFDGVMVDNSMKYSATEFDGGGNARSINPRTGTYWTDADVINGCIGVLNAIANAIGPNKILLPNGMWNGSTFFANNNYRQIIAAVSGINALMSEGAWSQSYASGNGRWVSEADWLKSVNMLIWVQNNFLNSQRYFISFMPADTADADMPPNTTREQLVMFGYCSHLLGAGIVGHHNLYYGGSNELIKYPSVLSLMRTLRVTDIGNPSGDYYQIAGTSTYTRDFVGGKVLVNPSATSYQVSLSQTYKNMNGQPVTSVTMAPHTGVLLFARAL